MDMVAHVQGGADTIMCWATANGMGPYGESAASDATRLATATSHLSQSNLSQLIQALRPNRSAEVGGAPMHVRDEAARIMGSSGGSSRSGACSSKAQDARRQRKEKKERKERKGCDDSMAANDSITAKARDAKDEPVAVKHGAAGGIAVREERAEESGSAISDIPQEIPQELMVYGNDRRFLEFVHQHFDVRRLIGSGTYGEV